MKLSILFIGFIVGYLMALLTEFAYKRIYKKTGKEPMVHVKGFHIHHSFYGLLMIILSFFIYPVFLLGTGLGLITRHTLYDKRLTFIDRNFEGVYGQKDQVL